MPEVPHYAFNYTLSTADDVRASWTQELLLYVDRNCAWYALKHELGDNDKLHIHCAFVYEIQTSESNGGAKTASNAKRTVMNACPTLKDYLMDNPSRYAVVCSPLKSDEWIATYLQKEDTLKYFRLPEDLFELKPYFADLQKDKPLNPEYAGWVRMYEEEGRPQPCTYDDIWQFFGEHMHMHRLGFKEIKIVADLRKLKERCIAMVSQVNCTIPVSRESLLGKRDTLSMGSSSSRVCPRCIESNYDCPNLLEYRQQYCGRCKNY